MKGPRLVVRALLVENDRLLCDQRPSQVMLYGGRIEKGETARRALGRELDEELGLRLDIGPLAYHIENFFVDREGRRIHEFGLYYLLRPTSPLSTIQPRQPGRSPTWFPIAELERSLLVPTVLRTRFAADLQKGLSPVPIQLTSIDRVAFPEVL